MDHFAGPSRKHSTFRYGWQGEALLGVQHELLHAPVQELTDPEHVLGWAGDRVDPAELLQLLAGLAEHAQDLALERQPVDAPRPGVGAVEHGVGAGRDGEGPGRARGESAAGDGRLVRYVADRRPRVGRHRHVDGELALEIAVAVEYLNAVIAAVGDVDVALGVGRDRMRRVELAGTFAAVAPRFEPVAVLVDLGDARIDVAVADEGVAGGVESRVGDLAEAARLGWISRLPT